jgi:hypothetical protein
MQGSKLGFVLATGLSLGLYTNSAFSQTYVDGGNGSDGHQETFNGISIHTCPVGYAMEGAHVSDNAFLCVEVVPTGQESNVTTLVDADTQAPDDSSTTIHVCPNGMYMRGLHNGKNLLVCSAGANVGTINRFLDKDGATQGSPQGYNMHVCPSRNNYLTVMVGIQDSHNDFACASLSGSYYHMKSKPPKNK